MPTSRRAAIALAVVVSMSAPARADDEEPTAAPARVSLLARRQVEAPPGTARYRPADTALDWRADRTAFVICDMWDQHWCQSATARVAEMAPRVNDLAGELRRLGALIIHCPSDVVDYYRDHPGRALARQAPEVDTALPLLDWCPRDPQREPPLPIDDSDEGCDCRPQCEPRRAWSRQIDTIEIGDGDAITDSAEAFYLMKQRDIRNVIVAGVHTNMCVLGRPFSIRQMVRQGQSVVLVRDLTDTMYNPRMSPFVSHFAGTDLVVEHIERHWCPTITSDQILGGAPHRFAADQRKHPGR
jgi:nicotinamidase-related amidase